MRKRLGTEIKSIRETGVAKGVVGELTQLMKQDNTPVQGSYGQDLYTIELIDKATGEVTKWWADAGFRGTMKMLKIQPGQHIEVEHTGEKKIDSGTVQTYAFYEVTE